MKTLLTKFAFAIVILLTIIILGLLVPIIFSLFIVFSTPITFTDCVQTGPFWLFTIVSLVTSCAYFNDVVNNQ